jgi:hypothetical protein
MLEEEFGELTVKQKEFVRVIELVCPSRFIGVNLRWSGMGRPMSGRDVQVFWQEELNHRCSIAVIPSCLRLCAYSRQPASGKPKLPDVQQTHSIKKRHQCQ